MAEVWREGHCFADAKYFVEANWTVNSTIPSFTAKILIYYLQTDLFINFTV